MGLFLVRKDRIMCISDRTVMITGYILGVIIELIAKRVIKKLKRRKSPGPDGIPMEFWKELRFDNISSLLALLNDWFANEKL